MLSAMEEQELIEKIKRAVFTRRSLIMQFNTQGQRPTSIPTSKLLRPSTFFNKSQNNENGITVHDENDYFVVGIRQFTASVASRTSSDVSTSSAATSCSTVPSLNASSSAAARRVVSMLTFT